MEPENKDPHESKLPLHQDIMQLARLGEIGPIQTLFEEGKYTATYKDAEGITPLHWAAINNHYALCKFLLESGADVNAIGGESEATAAMWAVQKCHYYVVDLLLQYGADSTIADNQGYKMIHLATFDGNAFMLLIILLRTNSSVDEPDKQGHTSLMWAAYNRLPAIVDLLLRWGASVNSVDETGFQPLHWALVKGSPPCILKLIEGGSDRFARTSNNKTPNIVAEEMRTTRSWHRALNESGYSDDATVKRIPIPYASFIKSRGFLNKFFFLCPFFILPLVCIILSKMVIYAAIPLSFFCGFCLQWAAQRLLFWAPSNMKHLHRTPYLAGVFAASAFWVGVRWIVYVLPTTYTSQFHINVLFGVFYSFCAYFYSLSMIQDPGYVPKLSSRSQQKEVVDELLRLWKFDEENFCTICLLRRPLRSKHCKRCGRCVAKHDHHCPWIHNCVGANNHRHFYLYILAAEVGILLLVRLTLAYLDHLPPLEDKCNLLSPDLCSLILRDPITVALTVWCILQWIWITMLLVVQSVQIARAMTTSERMRSNDFQHGSAASRTITSALTTGSITPSGAGLTNTGVGPNPAAVPSGHATSARKAGCFAQWKKLLGLDTFVATVTGARGMRNRKKNPFSRGVVTNCSDFWCDPAPYLRTRESGSAMFDGELVNYHRMYETVPKGRASAGRDVMIAD